MLACFDEIDQQIRTSNLWWRGDGADKSRNTWITKFYPKRALIKQEVSGFILMLQGVGHDLAYRDAGAANSGEDLLEWYPIICETVYGELNTQHQDLKKKQSALEDKPERTILGMVGVSGDYATLIEAVRQTNQGLDRWLLVQEPYRDRIKAPYSNLMLGDTGPIPTTSVQFGLDNIQLDQPQSFATPTVTSTTPAVVVTPAIQPLLTPLATTPTITPTITPTATPPVLARLP